jgi:PAS domain S-box-containing protein
MASEGSTNGRNPAPLLLALIIAGLAGNYFRYPLFFNIDFIFGSIFSLLALQFFGFTRGLAAALLIGCYTYILWNHPYAIIIMTAEAALVGWLVTRRKMGMVLADTLYWLCLGMPLVYLFYHVIMHDSSGDVNLTMIKQAMNGIANALAARLLFTGYALRSRSLTISFREIVYNLLALFVLCPALILLAVDSRTDFYHTDREIRGSLSRSSQRISSNLQHWLSTRKENTVQLAQLAATLPLGQMQARLEQAMASDSNFLRIGLLDKKAITTAYFPLFDELGHSNLGRDFSERPFIRTLQGTLKPFLSEVVLGKVGTPKPVVTVLAPVVVDGKYAGFVAGILALDRVHAILKNDLESSGMLYTLLDKNGKVIISNRQDQKQLALFTRAEGELEPQEQGVSRWVPTLPVGTPSAERWKKSLYVAQSDIGHFAEWRLILEQPVEPFQKALCDRYAGKLDLLLVIFIAALFFAELLSRLIHASISQLHRLSSDLPARLEQGQQISWPGSPVLEMRDLMGNFEAITGSLTAQILRTRELNENLELRVAQRTAELSSLNRDFVSFLENTSDFIYYKDENSRFRFCSQTLAAITGHACWRDMIGKHDLEVFPEDMARCYYEEELPIFRDGLPLLNKVNPYYDAQGRKAWVSTNKWPVFDESRKVAGIFGISRDITQMMQIQESLRLARQSLDQVPDPIMWADLDGRIVDCNKGACQTLGYSQQELLGSTIFAIDPVTSPGNWQGFFADLREQRVRHFESSYRTKEGRHIPMDVQVTYISFGAQEFLCGVARDITDRKTMEDKLRQSESSLSRAQEIAKLGSWEWDPSNDRMEHSDESLAIFGVRREGCPGTFTSFVESLVLGEDRERVLGAAELARRAGVWQPVEYRISHPDGSLHWIRAIGELVCEPDTTAIMIGANQDITEGKLMEEERLGLERQALHLQKLESLGVLSGGIAHDFNNLLQVVLGNLDLSLMILPEEAEVRWNLEQSVIATVRAAELSGMMLAYSGKGVLAVQDLNLSDLVQENSGMLTAVLGGSVSFSADLPAALPPVQADAAQLLQVIMNLVRNASEAIGEGGGSITLTTGVGDFDQMSLRASRLEEKLAAGRYVWIEVKDTGCGMDQATQYKIFDPFFSTKFTGRGLGMSAALGIMRAHKGGIMLKSSPGVGTTVRLLFPLASDPTKVRAGLSGEHQEVVAGGDERHDTILVVDDEEMIRTLTVAMLQAFGYHTLVAVDGEQALDIFRREAGRISLVLLDQNMPIMDGLTVFKELRRIQPQVKVLLASGHSEREVAASFQGLDLNGFIQKPFNVQHLSDEIERVLQ